MLQNRPPIVVILGHVDHGKTSLLDALRQTDVAAREIGGITQSVHAFQVSDITFIDTPGHAAFSQMRSRGGQIADLALLVVSAADGVMPQTKESISVIKSARLPFIVTLTKTDLPDASTEKVISQLAEADVVVEKFGGQVPAVAVSAKTGAGLPELLEMIHLINQLNPAQADPAGSPEALVLESTLDPKKGSTAVVIVKNGTFSPGQSLYLGMDQIGKIRALTAATTGLRLDSALPSTPVEILGLYQVPAVGSAISTQPTPTSASKAVPSPAKSAATLDIILKADVLGSLEALTSSLPSEVNLILSGTGDINESDVLAAQSTGAHLIGFNVKVPSSVAKLAQTEKIAISTYNIIYELLDAVDQQVHPQSTEILLGKAQIIAEFKIDSLRVAGCTCLEGEISKSDTVRVAAEVSRVKSLRVGKTEVAKVKAGQQFGVVFTPPVDFKVGATIIAVKIKT